MNALLEGLPSALVFGGIPWSLTYFLIIKRKKIHVRNWVWWAYFAVTMAVVSFVFSAANSLDAMHPKVQEDPGFFVGVMAFALFFSSIACVVLRWQEQKRNAERGVINGIAYQGHLAFERGEPADVNPYSISTVEFGYWDRGYQVAKRLKGTH